MLIYREGDQARRGGVDLVLSLTPDQAAALGPDLELAEALDTLLVGLAALRTGADPVVPAGAPDAGVSLKDHPVATGLSWLEWLIRDADLLGRSSSGVLAAAIREHAALGGTYGELANVMGVPRSTAQRRRDSVMERPPGEEEKWATAHRRDRNMEITEYTAPEVLTVGVAQGWAEAETDPTRINWAERQAKAWVKFNVADGRPVNPIAPTGIRRGRGELGVWGEQQAADAFVTLTDGDGRRRLLMVERDDRHGWALPGGMLDEGEEAAQAAARELSEETGLLVPVKALEPLQARVVPDPRASDEAWVSTIVHRVHLGDVYGGILPPVRGASDARRAEWVVADTCAALKEDLADRFGGTVFSAHEEILHELLG